MTRTCSDSSCNLAAAASAANRALIWMLLETHSQNDVHAMMQRTLSGGGITLEQVRAVRKAMLKKGAAARPTNVSLAHLRDEPAEPEPVDVIVDSPAPLPALPAQPAPSVRRPPAPPETFESQMARIAAGARLIAAPDFRTCGPDYTLGGVASGML
jgi:hypothetical protein